MNAAVENSFVIEETTVVDLHAAYLGGRSNVRSVVQGFLNRIAAYDRQGPALGLVISINPHALDEADRLDRSFAASGTLSGSLHGIPVLVKDNYDVAGLQTTAGSAAMLGWIPSRDSTVVAKLCAAGTVVLAKVTMSEWARGGVDNINSVLPGFARNPYNTAYATGGSSGGTGAGIAANFGVIGLGSDTWGSIRNPSSNNAIVGLRPSWALVSRAGMIGLYAARDMAGPMTRTVTDLAKTLDVIAGADPADPATAGAAGKIPASYTESLKTNGAQGKRLGVLRQAFPREASDPDVLAMVERAIDDLRRLGAEIVDPFLIADFDRFPPRPHPHSEVRAALERYLRTTAPGYPKTVAEILVTKKFHPLHEAGLVAAMQAPDPADDPVVRELEAHEVQMRRAYSQAMQAARLDAMIMPTASYPPKLNGDRNTTPTGTTTWIASGLHWPALIVPMGFSGEDLPSGLQFIGEPWSDAKLIEIGYAYEQATKHRHPPSSVPPLRCRDELAAPRKRSEVFMAASS
jgi:amidase